MARAGEPTQLYLVVPCQGAGLEASETLARIQAACRTGRVSTVLLETDGESPPSAIAALIAEIQKLGIAALVTDPALARVVKADGVHVPASKSIAEAYREARETLSGRLIAGADAGRSRHDAMTLGEAGADYVAFGIPPHVEDRETAADRRRDLVAWWTEIFEVPCVAFDVATPADAEDLIEAGADFIAVRLPDAQDAAATAAYLAPFMAALDLPVTAEAT